MKEPVVNSVCNTDEVELLSSEQLHALDRDQELQTLLRSERLTKHILHIDEAPDRVKALKRLRSTVPEFHAFCGAILKITEDSRPQELEKGEEAASVKDIHVNETQRLVSEYEETTMEAITEPIIEQSNGEK